MATRAKSPASDAKALAKRLIFNGPEIIRNNRVFYEVQKGRALRGVRSRPELTARRDLLDALDRDGIVVLPDYLPREQVDEMLAAAHDTMERARRGELEGDAFTVQPEIVVRVARADHLVPATKPFFDDEVIRGVFEAYISPDIASYRHELEYRFGLSQMAQADLWHFDNWRPICKAFLYLVDVGEDNAPFRYLKGTHKNAPWRRRYELEYDVQGPTGRFGHYFPQEIRALREEHGWEELVCTGTAGTLILADFRGLHRGTPLQDGRRVLLNNTFDLMNPEAA